jgi:hypothetical protein
MSIVKKAIDAVVRQTTVERLAQHILKEIFKVLSAQGPNLNGAEAREVLYTVLGALVGKIAYDSLTYTSPVSKTKQDLFNEVSESFLNCKINLQESIAVGMENAVREFSKQEVEYFCALHPVQDSKSKKVH